MKRLFVDLDGVLADFDAHYETVFGRRTNKADDDVDWSAVRATPGFYEYIPPMRDAGVLWHACLQYDPTVLTGIPSSVVEAEANKRSWVRRHLGARVPVICCRSRDKSLHATAGDVLIDDWDKYRDLWENMGGTFILHGDVATTISRLHEVMRSQ